MATIKKTIQNLKPGKQYLLTVKPKDAELNVLLDPASAVRFTIPADLTQPAELGDLTIVGNYKSIMISFNPSNEADLRGYNYEVYLPEDIAQSGSTYAIISGATPFLSGFSASNVIAVDVPQNSETTNNVDSNTGVTTVVTTEKLYFARVQSIDTSANKSAWTPIVASTATTLIDSAHIVDLTASKITAGTIGAHTITLAGGTSVIKSSTFNGVDVGGGSYANATTGWLINGSGRAYFYDATIAGSIDIGGFDSGSFHVDSEGNLWLGSGTLVNAPFKVLKEGDVTANTITTKNLTLTGNTVMSNNSKIFLGTGVYSNTNTPFYVDDTSKFSLGNKLTWDGSTLTITGNVNITGGNTLTLINDAQSDADTAYSVAISANSIAVSAQSTANDAYSEAVTRILPGELEARINDSVTNISGGKITTGSINANLITTGTLSADYIFGGTISGSAISLGSLYVDTGGFIQATNVEIAAGFRYRCSGVFNSTGSSTTARVHNPGSAEALCSPSSKREYKYNIEDIPDALNILKTVRPRIFNWKIDNFDKVDPWTGEPWTEEAKAINEFNKSYGFIAEEMAEDQPLLTVYESPDASLPKDQPGGAFDFSAWKPKMWKEMDFIPLLVKAVQELSAKVEELESRLNS
jgi:hypothetical protein